MEVDRVSQMGGGQDDHPSWGARAKRRKFVEEVPEPESEAEDAVEAVEPEEKHEGGLDVIA